ncbi:ABC transporter ATP-binding protein [Brevibacterium sp. Marseille-P9724]|uniref:ABC transporter ATP-binding protein n=1 Tax=Brevibacterium sp. Marseille-P9724 TaxID=2614125 RepID=UPI001D003CC3|nr:ABC transporter ATP-binding protein [Brevibacterium sp. Marseille-P9724]
MQIELKRLHADLGTTFVFVTHDQEEALAMSDRIVVLSGGKIQQIGNAEEIYLQPANRFVAGFIGKQNFVDAKIEAIEGDTAVLRSSRSKITARAVQLPEGASRGDAVEVAIRPENMKLTPLDDSTAAGQQNRAAANDLLDAVEGKVVGVSFLGDVVQYIVRLFDGHEILVRESALSAQATAAGAEVCVSWGTGQVQVFSHER